MPKQANRERFPIINEFENSIKELLEKIDFQPEHPDFVKKLGKVFETRVEDTAKSHPQKRFKDIAESFNNHVKEYNTNLNGINAHSGELEVLQRKISRGLGNADQAASHLQFFAKHISEAGSRELALDACLKIRGAMDKKLNECAKKYGTQALRVPQGMRVHF